MRTEAKEIPASSVCIGLTERTERMKQRLLASPVQIDMERARGFTKAWKEGKDKGPCMRSAVALAETLRNIEIRISDDELLVGVKSSKERGEGISIERNQMNDVLDYLLRHRSILFESGNEASTGLPFNPLSMNVLEELVSSITEDEARELRDIIKFWKGKTARDLRRTLERKEGLHAGIPINGIVSYYRMIKALGGISRLRRSFQKDAPKKSKEKVGSFLKKIKLVKELPMMLERTYGDTPELNYLIIDMQGHIIPGYKRVLEIGFRGIQELARKGIEDISTSDEHYQEKTDFYRSVELSAQAVCEYSNRFEDLAEQMAHRTSGTRREELLQIAERCRHVPANPPRNFIEAIQSFYMTFVAMIASYGMENVLSPGRLDQIFYPYYAIDIADGILAREQALELIEELMIKLSDNLIFGPNNITIGGLDRNGEDAVNDLSYLFLDSLENINGMKNGLAARISGKNRGFLLRACSEHQRTAGIAFHNDPIVIRDLKEVGYDLQDARDYSIVGCTEPTATGNDYSYTLGGAIFLTGALEMALNKGRRIFFGRRQVGASTADPRTFQTFEDVKEAFENQVIFMIEKGVRLVENRDRIFAREFPVPLISSTLEGCLERGLDATRGGAIYNNGNMGAQGLATVANSLAAIQWAVFDEQILTMPELLKHLRNNFENAERIRQLLLNKAPKFGNDDKRVDEIAKWVAELFSREVRKHKSWRGACYRPTILSAATHDMEGRTCIATPDGRLAAEAVSTGVSAANGTEKNGITAVLRSVAHASQCNLSNGSGFNMTLSPSLFNDQNLEKTADMLEAYFEMTGRQVQFNVISADRLKDAQAHPEKYKDLTVKVSGFSARFIDIGESLQNDIIARTQFN